MSLFTDTPSPNIIELKNLSQSYDGGETFIIKDLDFLVEDKPAQGQFVVILGMSGCGKSTLGKLAAALYQPTQGQIFYSGNLLEELNGEFFRKSVAWLGDESIFFLGSLRNNLTFWNADITDETLHQVGDKIGDSLQLNRWVMEEGKNLSKSEKQKLDLARIFLKNPSLLIIDQGLYALSRPQQEKVIEELRRIKCTLLCITYDTFLLDKCDRVLHLNQGEIV